MVRKKLIKKKMKSKEIIIINRFNTRELRIALLFYTVGNRNFMESWRRERCVCVFLCESTERCWDWRLLRFQCLFCVSKGSVT